MAGTALCGAHFAGEARLSTLRAVIVLGGGQRMVQPTPPPLSRRRLATAAFDQAVTFLLFTYHEHVSIMQLVGRWGVLRCRYWWDLGLLPPYCTNAPLFSTLSDIGVLQHGHVVNAA